MGIRFYSAAMAAVALVLTLPGCAVHAKSAQNAQQSAQNEKQAGQPSKQTSIHFADLGNVWTWRADNANEMYIQSNNRKWYRATFWSPCYELPYAVAVSFVTEPNGDLSRYSSVLVRGERCWFKSFEPSAEPPKAKKSKRARD